MNRPLVMSEQQVSQMLEYQRQLCANLRALLESAETMCVWWQNAHNSNFPDSQGRMPLNLLTPHPPKDYCTCPDCCQSRLVPQPQCEPVEPEWHNPQGVPHLTKNLRFLRKGERRGNATHWWDEECNQWKPIDINFIFPDAPVDDLIESYASNLPLPRSFPK